MTKIYWIKKVPNIVERKVEKRFPKEEGFTKRYYFYKNYNGEKVYAVEVSKNGRFWDNSMQSTLKGWENYE